MRTKALIFIVSVGLIFAGCAESSAKADKKGMYEQGKDKKSYMENKFYKKMYFILANEDEIGLSEEQKDKIYDLKYNLRKNMITKEADIEVVAIEIKQELKKDEANMSKIDTLLNQKYDMKKQKTRDSIKAYLDLKKIINDGQMEELKQIWSQYEKADMRNMKVI
jgi:hypothetical protein